MQWSSDLRVERTGIVERLLVLLRHLQAHAFFGIDVYHYGVVDVFHRFEHLDEAVQVIAMFHIAVGIAHGAEEVGFSLAIGVAEKPEVGVYAAVVFGDAHLVVVDHHDEVRAECRSIVKAFEGDSAAERTIADHGNYVFLITLEVTGLGYSGREGNGRGGVAEGEEVVWAFGGVGIAGHVVIMRGIGECLHTACQHLMGICLVGDVEYYLVFRSVEYIVECNDGLHHTKVGTYVAAMYG